MHELDDPINTDTTHRKCWFKELAGRLRERYAIITICVTSLNVQLVVIIGVHLPYSALIGTVTRAADLKHPTPYDKNKI